jgi:ankyrin repeat protein
MRIVRIFGIVITTLAWCEAAAVAQTADKVDFARDVQPIFRQYCVGCHGATIHQSNYRLDRRSDAMRGGTTSPGVIHPGDGRSSVLYIKISSSQFGPQMPPTGPLSSEQIDIIKRWIDQGAEWPDALAGESTTPVPTPRLMASVLARDRAAVQRLLDAGADPNARNGAGATALMWAVDDLDMTRLLLEYGADVTGHSDDGRTAIMAATGRVGAAPVVRLLLEYGADPAESSRETNPLFASARIGDADLIQLLIDRGVDVNKSGFGAIMWALKTGCSRCADLLAARMSRENLTNALLLAAPPSGDARDLAFLIDHGADVNGKDPEGRTPLLLAAASDVVPPSVITALIDRGADVNVSTASGQTPLDLARQRGKTRVVDLLVKAGAKGTGDSPAPTIAASPAASPRAAVERALPTLQRADVTFLKKSGCVGCHNNTLTAMAVSRARAHGVRVDETVASDQKARIGTFVGSWRERLLQGIGIPGEQDTLSYILIGLAAERYPADEGTDAMVRFLRSAQAGDGSWPIGAHRPPLESSDIQVTAASMRALQLFAPRSERAAYDAAIRRAAEWLPKAEPRSTEERAFQLLGLGWSKASRSLVQKAAGALLAEQRPDGGWSQLSTLSSDAYATGQALVALAESGAIPVSDAAYQRGVRFLLSTQLADGSWFVRTRAIAIQPYFESDFPHGRDQFISAAATSWATMALTMTIDRSAGLSAPRSRRP